MDKLSLNHKANLVLKWFAVDLDTLPPKSFISRYKVNKETLKRELVKDFPELNKPGIVLDLQLILDKLIKDNYLDKDIQGLYWITMPGRIFSDAGGYDEGEENIQDFNTENRNKIIDLIIKTVKDEGNCRVGWAAEQILKKKQQNNVHDKIAGLVIRSNEYIKERNANFDKDWNIIENPNYELNENVKITNTSIRELNKLLRKTNIWSVIIAGLTGLFIAMQYFKDDVIDLQPIRTQLEQQVQLLDSIARFQRGVDSSLRKAVKDSFYQKHH